MSVGGSDPSLFELVSTLGIGLDEGDNVVRLEELELPVPDLDGGHEVPEVDPTVIVHLEAVPLGEMAQDSRHRAAKGV